MEDFICSVDQIVIGDKFGVLADVFDIVEKLRWVFVTSPLAADKLDVHTCKTCLSEYTW